MSRFGFVKFKKRAAAADALEKLAGKQMADFPGQNVRPSVDLSATDNQISRRHVCSLPFHKL